MHLEIHVWLWYMFIFVRNMMAYFFQLTVGAAFFKKLFYRKGNTWEKPTSTVRVTENAQNEQGWADSQLQPFAVVQGGIWDSPMAAPVASWGAGILLTGLSQAWCPVPSRGRNGQVWAQLHWPAQVVELVLLCWLWKGRDGWFKRGCRFMAMLLLLESCLWTAAVVRNSLISSIHFYFFLA